MLLVMICQKSDAGTSPAQTMITKTKVSVGIELHGHPHGAVRPAVGPVPRRHAPRAAATRSTRYSPRPVNTLVTSLSGRAPTASMEASILRAASARVGGANPPSRALALTRPPPP